jgi:hypothetical protein
MRTSGINNSFDPSREPNLSLLLDEQQQAQRLVIESLADEMPTDIHLHLIALDLAVEDVEYLVARVIQQVDDSTPLLFLVLSTLPIGSLDSLQCFATQALLDLKRNQKS